MGKLGASEGPVALATSASNTNQLGPTSRLPGSMGQNMLQQLLDEMKQIEDTVDSIEIPARGRCKVYMAKFGYDPFKQSPNDNPDAEMAFNAGDYIMVFDDIDEDGYFIGELMDGRRGYVPSNWLERLTGEDLFEFQATTLYKQPKDDESESNSYPPEFYDAIVSDTMNHSNFQHLLAPEDYHRMNDYVDLDDVDEVDDECLSDYERAEAEQMRRAVAPPQRLVLERQLNKSILIGWLHPQAVRGTIVSYQVYVDGVLKSTVPSGDRTKALLEGVDSSIPHRISVRAIDHHGQHSNDAGCTIVIGQKIPFAPSCVKASHVTSDSALISWLPCNSNFHHVVAVNSVEVQTVGPGVYKHLINGLSANTIYRVWVRAKPGKILSIDEKNPKKLESLTTYVDFKTLPKSLPDPPVNVQVEAGPQRRTLLVTWLPLTLNDFGSSNGCAVTGYAVFAGHKKLADIDSPTGDHALLDLSDLESLHKKSVTVRTKSGENLSQDSMPCQIPDEYLKAAAAKALDNNQQVMNQQPIRHGGNSLHMHHRADARHSPTRHSGRYATHESKLTSSQQHPQQRLVSNRYPVARGRQMARSLQNLESDLDSRRSSIPAIEIARETSGSDFVNHAESYSEEEFESSMRFRGVRGKPGSRMNARYRPRQSHSVDSSVPHLSNRYNHAGNLAKSRNTPTDRDIRYFVALFDYDPATMSPNPNAAFEELAFKEGSIIKVVGDKGPDGFYRGELENRVGFVPSNVVSEITDPNVLYNLHEKSNQNRQLMHNKLQPNPNYIQGQQQQYLQRSQQVQVQASQQHQPQQMHTQLDPMQPQQGSVKRMTALYDYDPQENSPNADTESEIPFKVGDTIYVYGKMDTDGFYMGEVERTKQRGLVPSNFLREDPVLPNTKPPTLLQQQQQQQQLQQTMFSQPNGQMIGPIDSFVQHQRPPNPSQFYNPTVQQQQNVPLDPSLGGSYAHMQVNEQQSQMSNLNNLQIRGTPIRGVLPAQAQRGSYDPVIQSSQQNINRPTTLSLGLNPEARLVGKTSDWTNNPRQPLQGQNNQSVMLQQLQSRPLDGTGMGVSMSQQVGGGGQYGNLGTMSSSQQGQHQGLIQRPMLNNQQQAGGGVLSNLLSSGKQIIGAATTPRAPNQPSQFPSVNQTVTAANVGMVGGSSANIAEVGGSNLASRANFIQPNFHQADSSQQAHNSFNATNQMQQQQAQHYNQLGMNRGPMNQIGEEQGGNILNTVRNMFKLS